MLVTSSGDPDARRHNSFTVVVRTQGHGLQPQRL